MNILQYDYSVVFPERYADWMVRGSASRYRPFLSLSSTSPVTAAFVAMLRSVRPDLEPDQIKQVLVATSHPLEFEGQTSAHAVDIAAALKRAKGLPRR